MDKLALISEMPMTRTAVGVVELREVSPSGTPKER